MKNLAEEVHKSTIAVVHLYETQEHISQFRKDEQ
jgi:hypothetical protein